MYSWYWSSLQDWASTLISTTLIHYPSKPTDTHTDTNTRTHTPQRSPGGTEALPEWALLLNWLLGYASVMLQPADSLLNDVVCFLQLYSTGMGTCHGGVTWGTLRSSQLDWNDSKCSNISHSQDSFLYLAKKTQTNKKTHFLNDLFDLLGLDLQKSPTEPQPPVYCFLLYVQRHMGCSRPEWKIVLQYTVWCLNQPC